MERNTRAHALRFTGILALPILVLLALSLLFGAQTGSLMAAPAAGHALDETSGDEGSAILFAEVTASAGISMPYTFDYASMGQAWADVNGDGWLDLYMTTGVGPNKLYQNNGDGTFDLSPIAASVALTDHVNGGAVFADYDNDGWPDLYVLDQADDVLLHNDNGQGFTDVSAAAGIADEEYGVTGTWADYDQDGFLDLYVANNGTLPFNSEDMLYHNNGDGTFTDVSSILDPAQREKDTFTATWFDYDNDGDMDIYTVNDRQQRNVLWRNDGPGCTEWCFTDVSVSAGADTPVYGMGVAVGDYDADGDLDLYFSSIGPQVLLQNQTSQGSPTFIDVAAAAGVQADFTIGWGNIFFDYDNDGWLDLYLATFTTLPDPGNRLFHNNGDGTFTDVSAGSGADENLRTMGVAYADYDNDGWVDFVIGNYDVYYSLYRNVAQTELAHDWLTIRLDGEGAPFNRDAIGARVYLTTDDGRTQLQEVKSGSSIGAGNDLALHFGLGETSVLSVTVRWPDGSEETFDEVPINQIWELTYLPADLTLSATSMSSTQLANTIHIQTLDVGNAGMRDLTWQIEEDNGALDGTCDAPADIPWLSENPDNGLTPPGETSQVEVTFDATGMLAGTYAGYLCISSNDPDLPLAIVDIEMVVETPTDVALSDITGATRGGLLPVLFGLLLSLVVSLALIRRRQDIIP